jgi:hypothetical protein
MSKPARGLPVERWTIEIAGGRGIISLPGVSIGAAGRGDGRTLFVAFAFRGRLIRPISARYMHAKEESSFEAST